jgi:hypothetical protein
MIEATENSPGKVVLERKCGYGRHLCPKKIAGFDSKVHHQPYSIGMSPGGRWAA